MEFRERGTRPHRGLFVAFEGVERAGKTTQIELLKRWVQESLGLQTETFKFPDRASPTGSLIVSYLKGELYLESRAAQLLFASNIWGQMGNIRDFLLEEPETITICDRFIYSSIAYGASQDVEWGGDPHDCRKWYAGLYDGCIVPDLVINLVADPSELSKRPGFGEELNDKVELLKNVQTEYAAMFNHRFWQNLNALDTREHVHRDVVEAVEGLFGRWTSLKEPKGSSLLRHFDSNTFQQAN